MSGAARVYGPMFQRAIDSGKLRPDTPARIQLESIFSRIPAGNRGVDEPRLRELMREASRSGLREIHYLDDGERASVFTNPTFRFPPEVQDYLPPETLAFAERRIAEMGHENLISAFVTTGRNDAGYTMNFEIVVPKYEADLLLAGGLCFFESPKVEHSDGLMLILPGGSEQFSHISTGDSAAIVAGTNYPGNAGKKTLMTIAGRVASHAGLLMEHFGLGVICVRDPKTGAYYKFNVKVGGASFTGKTTTLTKKLAECILRGREYKITYNDDMIFVDPKTGEAYSMENGQFFTCTSRDRAFMIAQADPKTIGYNLVVDNGQFNPDDKRSDPNSRVMVRRGAHEAIDVDHFNTVDTEDSSRRIDASIQLFRGAQFPPAFIMNPDMAAVWLAAGPTQKTAAQKGGSSIDISGCREFTPILDYDKAEQAARDGAYPAFQQLFGKTLAEQVEMAKKIVASNDNMLVQTTQLINDLFVSGFITEDPRSYMDRLMGFYGDFGDRILHIGLNTGKAGPVIADTVTHPFDDPLIRLHDFSAPLDPVVSQDGYMHALRGEIRTEYDPALGVHVITQAGNIHMDPLLPRARFKRAGIDYEKFVKDANEKYAKFLEQNGLHDYAHMLRKPPKKPPFVSLSPEKRFDQNKAPFSKAKPPSDPLSGAQAEIIQISETRHPQQGEAVRKLASMLDDSNLIVDLTQINFIDSSTIGALQVLYSLAREKGRFFALVVSDQNVRGTLHRLMPDPELAIPMFEYGQAARVAADKFELEKNQPPSKPDK